MITLDEETEAQLRAAAEARGQDLNSFAVALLQEAARESAGKIPPTSPAELIAELEAEGTLTGYGDPAIDSPELARALREQFSRREPAA